MIVNFDRNKIKTVEPTNKIDYMGIFGLKNLTSSSVNIAIIASGAPVHSGFQNVSHFETFVDLAGSPDDSFGLSTITAGIVAGNDSRIKGLSPNSNLLFTKAINDNGIGDTTSLVASVLWAIVHKANVIIIPIELERQDTTLADAFKKAYQNGIAVVMPFFEKDDFNTSEAYPECLSVTSCKGRKFGISSEREISVTFPYGEVITTYLKDKYVLCPPQVAATAIVGGLYSVCADNLITEGTKPSPRTIIDELFKKISKRR